MKTPLRFPLSARGATLLRRSLHLLLVLSFVLCLDAGVGIGQTEVSPGGAFGPTLYLLASAASGSPPEVPPTVIVHARLEDAGRVWCVASGPAAALADFAAAGLSAQVLDTATAGRVYYWVDAETAGARELADAYGDILFAGSRELLVGLELDQELPFVEALPAQGINVSLLAPQALVPPTTDDTLIGELQGAAITAPDPAVTGLLTRLTEADLRDLVEKLSGQRTVAVGGVSMLLPTRYTFSSRIRNAEQFVYEYYAALGLSVRYVPWTYGSNSGRNVVAEVRGASQPERVLLVGGHLDSNSQAPYSSAPGADDNATGTAVTLLIARLLRTYRPAITVRFVHFTGEEQGQWGSKAYARSLRLNNEQVIGFINLDMIGWDGDGDRRAEIHTASGPKSNALGTSFLERNDRYGQGIFFERKTTTASRFSDHSPFWDNDYASFLVIENFFTDAVPRDRNPYYHNTGDLPAQVNYNYVARLGRVALATFVELAGYNLAGIPPPPTPPPASCANWLVNGDFELTAGWSFGSTPYPAGYVTSPVYSGVRALRLGISAGATNRLAHSSAYQRIVIPATATAPVLVRYVERSGGAGDGVDYRETLLLRSDYSYLAKLARSYAAGDDRWTIRTYDLSAYRGQTVVLYFNVYNNGTGTQMWNYVDKAELGSCSGALTAQATSVELPDPSPFPAGWRAALAEEPAFQLFLPYIGE